ncbi:hypothetical protein [Bacillus sp. JCM 19041]|uniref:hypothetical protein n=1 Tax=Bacillus sp. JCM 19041 TaxID=1460637 RepID=UPI0006CFA041
MGSQQQAAFLESGIEREATAVFAVRDDVTLIASNTVADKVLALVVTLRMKGIRLKRNGFHGCVLRLSKRANVCMYIKRIG